MHGILCQTHEAGMVKSTLDYCNSCLLVNNPLVDVFGICLLFRWLLDICAGSPPNTVVRHVVG